MQYYWVMHGKLGGQKPDETIIDWDSNKKSIEEVIDIEKNWCGRYVLIIDECIYTDAVGLLQVFYSKKYVTSSISVLCKIDHRNIKKTKLIYGLAPDFIPGNITAYSDVYRLLPSEIYNFCSKKIIMRKLLPDGIPEYSEEHLKRFVDAFSSSLNNMKKHFCGSDVWLALTGGKDSRTTMALLEYAGIPYKTFTLEHKNISEGDIDIPKVLAKKVNKCNLYVRKKNKINKILKEQYNEHTAYMAVDQGRNFYSRNQYNELLNYSPKILILRSGIWECAVEYYFNGKRDKKLTISDLEQVFPIINLNSDFKNALIKWKCNIEKDVLNRELTVDERLYWEIRAADWLAAGESAFDMMDNIDSIQPANSRALIAMMLAFPENERINKLHEEKIIQYACNAISQVKYDDEYKTNKFRKMKKIGIKIQQFHLLVKYYGLKKMFLYYMRKR